MRAVKATETRIVAATNLSLEDFEPDRPPASRAPSDRLQDAQGLIDGVKLKPLVLHSDSRGNLCELLTTRDGPIEPIVHVYSVSAAPGSVRAWVYHRRQDDRLAFMEGDFEIVLYDLRPGSRSRDCLNTFRLGEHEPSLLRIPAFVIHGVKNHGSRWAKFINMPTRAYEPDTPDKFRLPADDPRIPYSFE